MTLTNDIDLFAGPGGWDEGIAELGIRPLGIEIDADACATARAAGHHRLQADVSGLTPEEIAAEYFDGIVRGLIASPPCQGFSMAGKGRGRQDADLLLEAIGKMTAAPFDVVREWLQPQVADDRSLLVLEPLRWALALGPEWMAWEQVPAVLPIWEACAVVLRSVGYTVATGVVNAEQYGVPQTRRRAILVARSPHSSHELGPAALPTPTHSRYYPQKPGQLDLGVRPWVSMAEALGWGMTHRPYPAVAVGTAAGGTDPQVIGGTGARAAIRKELEAGRWVERPGRWQFAGAGKDAQARATCRQRRRELNEPAHTVTSKGTAYWVRAEAPEPPAEGYVWVPQGLSVEDMLKAKGGTTTMLRVSVEEAGELQSFPPDYPWTGNSKNRYQQVGNAVPPTLARALVTNVAALGGAVLSTVVA